MLLFCNLQDEKDFYEKNWRKMIDDIEHQLTIKYHPIIYCPNETELQDLPIEELEPILYKNGVNIRNYNLSQKSVQYKSHDNNQFVEEELNYNIDSLEEEANKLYLQLNKEQKDAFHNIVNSVLNKDPKFYFVSGHGGTGKHSYGIQ